MSDECRFNQYNACLIHGRDNEYNCFMAALALQAKVEEVKDEWESCCERERARWEDQKRLEARVRELEGQFQEAQDGVNKHTANLAARLSRADATVGELKKDAYVMAMRLLQSEFYEEDEIRVVVDAALQRGGDKWASLRKS